MKKFFSILSFFLELSPNRRKFVRFLIDAILFSIAVLTCSILFSEIFVINLNENINLIISTIIFGLTFYALSGQYNSLTRYVGSASFYRLAIGNILLVSFLIFWGNLFNFYYLSFRAWFIVYLSFTGFTGLSRFILRDILLTKGNFGSKNKTRVVIYGAGSAGAQLLTSLKLSGKYKIICFIDDDPHLWKRSINGIKISSIQYLNNKKIRLDQVLLAIPSLTNNRRREIIKNLYKYDIPVLQIPSVEEITTGKANIDNLRPITIEDLLGRDKVLPDPSLLGPDIRGEVVCVTGAGGSIGSELCRQIIKLMPKKLILLELSEPNLYLIEQSLMKEEINDIQILPILGNASDISLMKNLFSREKVSIVFHAAAYKHVPLVENNPLQGIVNNAFSTRVVCEAGKYSKLKKVILISTDKAVRPTNILGASKRLAELIVQAFAEEEELIAKSDNFKTIFSMVRFGNVLGSSGSVVPLFEKQIKNGGPVTITHPDIIRYFMTIPEAAQLVIQAMVLAEGGEVFLLDMGEPVKIYDLACQMIKLSGLSVRSETNKSNDIEIITTGLRPGEKLYEELLIDFKALKTKHDLIFKANERSLSPKYLWEGLNDLKFQIKNNNTRNSLEKLKELVPEWNMKDQKI